MIRPWSAARWPLQVMITYLVQHGSPATSHAKPSRSISFFTWNSQHVMRLRAYAHHEALALAQMLRYTTN